VRASIMKNRTVRSAQVCLRRVARFIAIALLFTPLLMSCHRGTAQSARLVVGMELDYPPFEMRDVQGRPSGISVEMAGAIAQQLHRELEVKNIPFAGLIPALKTGQVDLVISSMTITEERRQSIDFTEPYWRTGLGILTYEGSEVHAAADLWKPGIRVVVKSGTTGHLYARDHFRDFLLVDQVGAACLEVEQHKATAFLYDQLTLVRRAQEKPGLVPILDPVQVEQWGIGVAKGHDDLREAVNRYLQQAKAGGTFKSWAEKYLATELASAHRWGGEIIY
jgi:polar amino acid transport system substrate-binding protein